MIIITIRDETMHSYHMPSKFQPFGRGTRSPHIELHDLPTLNPPLFYIRVWVPLFSGFLHRYFLIQFWLFSLISSLAYILSLSHTHYASEYSTLLELDSLHGIRAWRLEILHWALPLKLCEQPETLLQIGYRCCSVAQQEAHVNRSIRINLNQKDECTNG